jgi:hypothetical protein
MRSFLIKTLLRSGSFGSFGVECNAEKPVTLVAGSASILSGASFRMMSLIRGSRCSLSFGMKS